MSKQHCRIGITGQIGSGKSTVARLLSNIGFFLISADAIARELSRPGQACYLEMVKHFGQDILDSDGEINRKKLRAIIFNHPHEKKWLEALLHPAIRQELYQQSIKHDKVVVEIPLLNNRDDYPWLDMIILITCDKDIAIQRIMSRDNCSYEQAQQILSTQMSDDERKRFVQHVIDNSGSIDEVEKQLKKLFQ